jgi:hypothetical protein
VLTGTENIDSIYGYIRDWLSEGDFIIAGVRVSPYNGNLYNYKWLNDKGETAYGSNHWILISGVSMEWNAPYNEEDNYYGDSPWRWVRIYNPMTNFAEYYPWGLFKQSWIVKGPLQRAILRVAPPEPK